MRTMFDNLSDSYTVYYSPTAHLEATKIIVLFRGLVIFRQCVLKTACYVSYKQKQL
jgi:hypothetical protein